MEAAAGVAATRGGALPMPTSRKEWRAISDHHHHSVRNASDEVDLEQSKLGHSDERTIYEQGRQPADVDFCSIRMDGSLDNDNLLPQRLHNIARQREELQRLEIDLRAQMIARTEIMEMQSSFDAQIKEHAGAAAKLQEQLLERDRTIHELERKMEEKEKNAKILSGIHPYFGVRLKAKLLLFSPKPNMLLEGKVVKLTQESIHVIVLGFSSAIIIDEDIREEFKYRAKHGEELFASRSNKRHKIKVGTMIRFLVKSFDEEILHISGSLIPAHTGSIRCLDKNSEDTSMTDRSTRKRREGEGETEMQENETFGGGASSLSTDHQTKKSKKRRFAEDH